MYICDMSNPLDRDIQFLHGVGPKKAALLNKELNVRTFGDLLRIYPFRYVDKSKVYSIRELTPDMAYVQIRGKIISVQTMGTSPRSQRLSAIATDGSGTMEIVFFHGIKWMKDKLKPGTEYIFFGKISEFNGVLNMVHPEIEPVENAAFSSEYPLMGIYPGTETLKKNGMGSKAISKLVLSAIVETSNCIHETLPGYILKKEELIDLKSAICNIHFPKSLHLLSEAKRRLKFEELFYLQLSLLKQKYLRKTRGKGIKMPKVGAKFNYCYSKLPFPLTEAQKRVIREVRNDMAGGNQMNRLLQGDVGSGKTAVAFLCSLIAIGNGFQACIMAPTEVLAEQHFNSAEGFFDGCGISIALLTGSTKSKEKKEILERLADGSIDLIIGTHALIEDNVAFRALGLAIIDEQHRFGVKQRSMLWKKSDPPPHILVMTATPIPRTLSMTVYGDLDVSVIDELPPGRKPVKTIHITEKNRRNMYAFLKSQIKAGRQAFIVYPLIKESEKMDYKNLEQGFMSIVEEFKAPEYVVAVVHGKQKNEDKAYDMNLFASGKAHILVATSVIEVGVNVPNASVMVIESAERFGLSQLHQLRGRVGRGSDMSYCILVTGHKLSKESRERIDLMCSTQDGFELAEADLKMRGPGDIEGTQQSGTIIDLKIANPVKDNELLEEARRMAASVLEYDPDLTSPSNKVLGANLKNIKDEIKDFSNIS